MLYLITIISFNIISNRSIDFVARSRDNRKQHMMKSSFLPATPFDYGSGHINPNKAMDPGLIYDITVEGYLDFLCSIGYDSSKMNQFSSYSCSSSSTKITNLNYPSITIPNLKNSIVVKRKVKNVGTTPTNYTVKVISPPGIAVTVNPSVLEFEYIGEEKSFHVSFVAVGNHSNNGGYEFGSLIWSDSSHHVRSPLVIKLNNK